MCCVDASIPEWRRNRPVSGCSSRNQAQKDKWTVRSSTFRSSNSSAEADARQICHCRKQIKHQTLGLKHTTGGDKMWADTHTRAHTPDKHANGIGYQEAVIQGTKQCLVVVLVWRENKDATFYSRFKWIKFDLISKANIRQTELKALPVTHSTPIEKQEKPVVGEEQVKSQWATQLTRIQSKQWQRAELNSSHISDHGHYPT